jgi:hypothetical protein
LVTSLVKSGVPELNEPAFTAVPGGAVRAIASVVDPEAVPGLLAYATVAGAIAVPVVFQVKPTRPERVPAAHCGATAWQVSDRLPGHESACIPLRISSS